VRKDGGMLNKDVLKPNKDQSNLATGDITHMQKKSHIFCHSRCRWQHASRSWSCAVPFGPPFCGKRSSYGVSYHNVRHFYGHCHSLVDGVTDSLLRLWRSLNYLFTYLLVLSN